MNDLVIFVVGSLIFAATTTATLLFSYMRMEQAARRDRVTVTPREAMATRRAS